MPRNSGISSVPDAARALGVPLGTLRRWLREGAPVECHGGRGRGRIMRLSPEDVAAWRRSRDAALADDRLRVLAGELPELVAAAIWDGFVACDGPHKRALAGELPGIWARAVYGVLDRLRGDLPTIPELATVPEKIDRLRAIFADSRKLSPE